MILIVTEKFDPHVDLVSSELLSANVQFHRLHLSDMPQNMQIHFSHDVTSGARVRYPLGEFDSSQIQTVWYRRPEGPAFPPAMSPEDMFLAKKECLAQIDTLWASLDNARWISRPSAIRNASSKARQLIVATALGLKTPKSCFSNVPEDIRAFAQQTGDIIYKSHTSIVLDRGEDGADVLYTRLLSDEDLAKLDQIKLCPGIFQEYVEKDYEIRVTLMGEQVFACQIFSQGTPDTKIDSRATPWVGGELPEHRPYKLPDKVSKQLKQMLKGFDLQFGTVDLIRRPDGEYVFLELNPNGQWAWLEPLTGQPMKQVFAQFLMSK